MNIMAATSHDLFNIRGNLYDFSKPKIMGILNLTPDSFSDGGKYNSEGKAVQHAEKMVAEGADIIDIGAQSTRPGASLLSAAEERRRIGRIIRLIKDENPGILISLDTFYADNVKFGYHEGIDIVNDISASQFDTLMFKTVAETGLPYILMHGNRSYEEMHLKINYEDITVAVNYSFSEKIADLKSAGVKDIILDPGFGFGKTVEDQHILLKDCACIGFQRFPLLIGISKKSFIYKPLGKTPENISAEMEKLHRKVLEAGAKILRVHEVAEAKKLVENYGD